LAAGRSGPFWGWLPQPVCAHCRCAAVSLPLRSGQRIRGNVDVPRPSGIHCSGTFAHRRCPLDSLTPSPTRGKPLDPTPLAQFACLFTKPRLRRLLREKPRFVGTGRLLRNLSSPPQRKAGCPKGRLRGNSQVWHMSSYGGELRIASRSTLRAPAVCTGKP